MELVVVNSGTDIHAEFEYDLKHPKPSWKDITLYYNRSVSRNPCKFASDIKWKKYIKQIVDSSDNADEYSTNQLFVYFTEYESDILCLWKNNKKEEGNGSIYIKGSRDSKLLNIVQTFFNRKKFLGNPLTNVKLRTHTENDIITFVSGQSAILKKIINEDVNDDLKKARRTIFRHILKDSKSG
jgi:hypothetical protein